jgi:hypothetical protein
LEDALRLFVVGELPVLQLYVTAVPSALHDISDFLFKISLFVLNLANKCRLKSLAQLLLKLRLRCHPPTTTLLVEEILYVFLILRRIIVFRHQRLLNFRQIVLFRLEFYLYHI